MKTRFPVLVLVLIASGIFGISSVTFAQQQQPGRTSDANDPTKKADINGTVVLQSGHPVDFRVRIRLSATNNAGMDLYTDTNGAFDYGGLQPGYYTLDVTAEDSHKGTAKEQVNLLAGQRVTLRIYLKTEEAGADKTGKTGAVNAAIPVPQKAKQEFDTAQNLVGIGDLNSAAIHFNNALKIFPAYVEAHNELGVVYLKLKRPDDAAGQFEAAIEISPKAYNPRLNLGIILVSRRKYPEAVEQLTQCVSIDSSQAPGRLYLGIASLGQDDLEVAKRELTAALDIGGEKLSVAHYYLAYVSLKSGDKAHAIQELESFVGSPVENKEVADQARALLQQLKK